VQFFDRLLEMNRMKMTIVMEAGLFAPRLQLGGFGPLKAPGE